MSRLPLIILVTVIVSLACADPNGAGQSASSNSTDSPEPSQNAPFDSADAPDPSEDPCSECSENQSCIDDACVCDEGFSDCDQDPNNGCETEGACPCTLGDTRPCYDGPTGTEGVGVCTGGVERCEGTFWGLCSDQVLPSPELCAPDGLDQDCDGQADDFEDLDGDGWTECDGDCCDDPNSHCAQNPALVNPGAFDFAGNLLDDDCDGIEDNTPSNDCSSENITEDVSGDDLARAMDLCQFTNGDPDIWGVVEAKISEANGFGTPNDWQSGVLTGFGAGRIPAMANSTLAVLSSGDARGVGDEGYTDNVSDGDFMDAPPEDYMDAHNQVLQTNPLCPASAESVHDTIKLSLTLRVPTNANGFKFEFRFFTYEYPMYLCTMFNDFFLALLKSSHAEIPYDKNISFDAAGNPVSVNNAFFTTCEALECFDPFYYMGPYASAPDADFDGCVDATRCDPETNLCGTEIGACVDGAEDLAAFTDVITEAGGTSWLTTTAPVVPGETITLDFHIWDTGDSAYDSLVILDSFKWLIEPTELDTKN